MNEVRIIGGDLRGRKIQFPSVVGLRPSLDAVRETLFNWLMFKVHDAVCLDAFAGSGALGFEALSRGASRVIFIEKEPQVIRALKQTQQRFKLESKSEIYQGIALPQNGAFDLIFLDPPFGQNLLTEALLTIAEMKLLKPEGLVYFEAEKNLNLSLYLGQHWQIYRHKKMGELQFGLLETFC